LRLIHHHHHHHRRRRRRRRRLQGLGLMACSDSEFNFSEFMNLWIFDRIPQTGDQPDARPLPTQDKRHRKTRTHIHASSGIRTRDPNVRAVRTSDRAAIQTGAPHTHVLLSIFVYQFISRTQVSK